MDNNDVRFDGFDVGKFIFALFIPFLHIHLPNNTAILLFKELVCRLGVPFFFAVSGFFLEKSRIARGRKASYIHYAKSVGVKLLFWLIVYSPFIIVFERKNTIIQELLFKTPCFLWFLTALIFGGLLICFISNDRIKYALAICLYIIGTLFSDTYSWLTTQPVWYTDVFMTFRNGLFFGFPMMCIGSFVFAHFDLMKRFVSDKKAYVLGFAVSIVAWISEVVLIVLTTRDNKIDRSMYLTLPVITFFIVVSALFSSKKCKYSKILRGCSSTLYLAQYGVITTVNLFFTKLLHFGLTW